MATPARLAGVGVFVLTGLLLFAIGLFMIGDRQMAFSKRFTLYTEFVKITGLQPGAIVRVSGARAGSVQEILPPATPSAKFKVRMEIIEDLHPLIRTDSMASIATEGLVGGSFLSIGTGSEQAPMAVEGATIAGKEPFEIADLLDQMGDTVKKINLTIDEVKRDVQIAVQSIGDTVENADDLIKAVGDDVTTMAAAGARITGDIAEITDRVKSGKGTIGKLVNDDELYRRAAGIAKDAEEVAAKSRDVVEQARKAVEEGRRALETFNSKDGPVQGVAANMKQTLDDARVAMSGFAQNMEALKHNFLLRGFFNRRGYFDLAAISPAQYRAGVAGLVKDRLVTREWMTADEVFISAPSENDVERLSDAGKARLGAAIAPHLEHAATAVVMVEGYAPQGTTDQQFVRSRARAASAREYLIGTFHLVPEATGLMPLGAEAVGSPAGNRWDGIALAVFRDKPKRR